MGPECHAVSDADTQLLHEARRVHTNDGGQNAWPAMLVTQACVTLITQKCAEDVEAGVLCMPPAALAAVHQAWGRADTHQPHATATKH
eukprot:14166139-Alexandrium_andersonii.AAC.1